MTNEYAGANQYCPTKNAQSIPLADGGNSYTDLNAFERDTLRAVFVLEREREDERPPTGAELLDRLEAEYGEELNHSRLYQTLDRLADRKLVERGQLDKRTNTYALTNDARALLVAYADRLRRTVGECPEVEA